MSGFHRTLLSVLIGAAGVLLAQSAFAVDSLYRLQPDGAGGTALHAWLFDGSTVWSSRFVADFSTFPPTSFGGIHYDRASQKLYVLESDGAGGTQLSEATFNGSNLDARSLVASFSGVTPDEQGGMSWEPQTGVLYYFAADGPGTTGLWSRAFDGTTLGPPTLLQNWSPTGGPVFFSGIFYDPAASLLYSLAPFGGGSNAAALAASPFDGTQTTGPGSVVAQISASPPSAFGGISQVRDPASFEDSKLLASDGAANDVFGWSVSVSGDVAVVGARLGGDDGFDPGSAYVYRWDGAAWTQQANLLASDWAAGDQFGYSVSVSGDVAVVGAQLDDDSGASSGSAYVYRWDGAAWMEQAKLLASDGAANDRFGYSVSVSGDVAVVGAQLDDDSGASSGSAYVYRWDGAAWMEQAKLLASDGAADDRFGYSVSVSGDVAVVGARLDDDDGASSGSAYVYRWDGAAWMEQAKLLASDGAADDRFGHSVSVSGDVAVVGAQLDDDDGADSGSAYVYRWDGAAWMEQAKLLASDGAADDRFGHSVSVSGDVAVVGAQLDDDSGASSGSAYVYRWDGAVWTEQAKLLASDGAANDRFGWSVSVSGDAAVVGAWSDDDNGSNSGSAYIFILGSCGDGALDAGEACDDGGRVPGDGCSGSCQVEECANGLDDDGDGHIDFTGADPGCWGAADLSEIGLLVCDNGIDDDGDGLVDAAQDPACSSGNPWLPDPNAAREQAQCQDGVNNDPGQDPDPGSIDFDGGLSALGYVASAPDPQCTDRPWKNKEKTGSCGLGFELALLLPGLMWLHRGRRRPS